MIELGEIINNRYKVIKPLAAGAMGEVFVVEDQETPNVNNKVILKILRSELADDKNFMERFQNEMIAGLLVNHPNVAKTYDYIQTDKFLGYTMDFIDGQELGKLMEETGCFDVSTTLSYINQIVEGTKALHQKGIIHRDLKPENIIIDKKGILKIVDFGISILDVNSRKSEAGSLLGSISYIAPEYVSENKVSEQSDIYAIGVIAYQLLTQELPFTGDNFVEQVNQKVNFPPIPLTKHSPDTPSLINDFILKMISRDPSDRFKYCSEIINRISQIKDMTKEEMDEFYKNNKEEFFSLSPGDVQSMAKSEESEISYSMPQSKEKNPEIKPKPSLVTRETEVRKPLISEAMRSEMLDKWKKKKD